MIIIAAIMIMTAIIMIIIAAVTIMTATVMIIIAAIMIMTAIIMIIIAAVTIMTAAIMIIMVIIMIMPATIMIMTVIIMVIIATVMIIIVIIMVIIATVMVIIVIIMVIIAAIMVIIATVMIIIAAIMTMTAAVEGAVYYEEKKMRYSFYQGLAVYPFVTFLEVLCDYCTLNATRLNINAQALDRLIAELAIATVKVDAVRLNANSGPGDTAAKNTAVHNAMQEAEKFVNTQVRYNEAWTAEDLIDAGFPPDAATGSSYPPITATGVLDVHPSNHYQHTAHFYDQDEKPNRAKGAAKVRVLRNIHSKETPAAAHPSECGNVSDAARIRRVFNYEESQLGLLVDYVACYLDPAGKPGLVYSEIITLEIT
ncbi:hypothetical protein ACYULU_15050 [Breznakiellaceae bacterium SP9]